MSGAGEIESPRGNSRVFFRAKKQKQKHETSQMPGEPGACSLALSGQGGMVPRQWKGVDCVSVARVSGCVNIYKYVYMVYIICV